MANGISDEQLTNRDAFYWMGELNKASAVMVTEQNIVSQELAGQIANAVTRVIADGEQPGAERPSDYLLVERGLIAYGGPDVTRLHSGRSRVDMSDVTIPRLQMREATLAVFAEFIAVRETLLRFAAAHANAIVPFYTQGVAAQPTTFGHYIGGYLEAFSRAADRYIEHWARLNQSPFGTAAGGTSSFPLNRQRLAELLGFDGLVLNSFDACHMAPLDLGIEASSLASTTAATVNMLITDLGIQYTYAKPWITLDEGVYKQGADAILKQGELTGTSSIMPQKRNPRGLQRLRALTGSIKGEAVTYLIQSHNIMHGIGDYKFSLNNIPYVPLQTINLSAEMFSLLARTVQVMKFDEARALKEVNGDYTMITRLADELQSNYDIPFRIGHHFASEIVTYGRGHDLLPAQIPYEAATQFFGETAKTFGVADTRLPLSEAGFRKALTPENMIQTARVAGGPQPDEVAKMLAAEKERLQADRAWLNATRQRLADAAAKLQTAFNVLLKAN